MLLFILSGLSSKFFIAVFLVSGIAAFSTYYFSTKKSVSRALNKTKVKKIDSFVNGDIGKIVGRVVLAGQTLQAPISKRKCCCYHIVVEEGIGDINEWHERINEEKKADVIIYDGTGYAIIDTGKMISYLIPDANYSSGTFNDASPEINEYLSHHNFKSRGLFGFNKTLRYKEAVLEDGEMVAVTGVGQWNETQDHKLNLPTSKVLVITAQEEEKVYLSDDPVTLEDADQIQSR